MTRPFTGLDSRDPLRRVEMVDVARGRGQVRMAELRLDHPQVDALARQLERVRVPQPVRVNAPLDPRLRRELLQQIPHVRRVHRLADARPADHAEQRLTVRQPELLTQLHPGREERDRRGVHADHPRLVPFPVQHDDRAAVQVDVLRVQRQRLRDPQAGAPQERDQRAVARAGRSLRASVDQREHLARRERLRRELPPLVRRRFPGPVLRKGHGRTVEPAPVARALRLGQRNAPYEIPLRLRGGHAGGHGLSLHGHEPRTLPKASIGRFDLSANRTREPTPRPGLLGRGRDDKSRCRAVRAARHPGTGGGSVAPGAQTLEEVPAMNARDQLELFGLCAYADEDKVVIVARDDAVELDPYVARRFAFYLARSYHDALRNSRRAKPTTYGPTPELV